MIWIIDYNVKVNGWYGWHNVNVVATIVYMLAFKKIWHGGLGNNGAPVLDDSCCELMPGTSCG